jgi:hypothetical protein
MVHPVGGFSHHHEDDDDDDDDDDDEMEEAEAMEVEVIVDQQHPHRYAAAAAAGGGAQDEASTDAEEDDDDEEEEAAEAEVPVVQAVAAAEDDEDADEVSSVAAAEVPSPPPPPAVAAAPAVAAIAGTTAARKTPVPSKKKRKAPASTKTTPTSAASASVAAALAAAMVAPTSASFTKKKTKAKKKAPPSHTGGTGGGSSSSKKKGSSSTTANRSSSSGGGGQARAPSYAKAYAKLPPIPPERLRVSSGALKMLQERVPVLPMMVGDVHIRSFGRLALPTAAALAKGVGGATTNSANSNGNSGAAAAAGGGSGSVSVDGGAQQPAPFATRKALYPVGFSCDRHEYSPAHGRMLKMRCSILDGRKIRQALQQQAKGGGGEVEIKDDVKPYLQDGPVFRVMWGRGVDEQVVDDNVLYPFHPKVHAAPIAPSGKTNETSCFDESSSPSSSSGTPMQGMRVKVRFDKNECNYGTITQASVASSAAKSSGKKSRKTEYTIAILYDDGSAEVAIYPDPDIILAMPGTFRDLCMFAYSIATVCRCCPRTIIRGSSYSRFYC